MDGEMNLIGNGCKAHSQNTTNESNQEEDDEFDGIDSHAKAVTSLSWNSNQRFFT